MKISYHWLKWYIPEIPSPQKLADFFTYHLCEVESMEKAKNDMIFDLNILPNRTHDLLCHLGVAREISSALGLKYNDPVSAYKIPKSFPTRLQIKIETDKCRRYMGRIVRKIKVGPSPEWVVKHLDTIGQRSINNIVDAANLVMYDSGQPAHAFDLHKLSAEKIIIRQAKEGEGMITLDNKEINLSEKDMVIADEKQVLAVAGIKGGKNSGVDEDTRDIVLEVANFDPTSVRRTAQSLNLFTDARKRFENDLSPELGSYAMRELSALILEMCPEAEFEEITDVYPVKQTKRSINFSAARISEILGLEISAEKMAEILKKYNFSYKQEGDKFSLQVPALRLDLEREEDMAEEFGRIAGYDKIAPEIPKINFQPRPNETYRKILWAREKLLSEGYSEVMTYTFAEKGEIEVRESPSDKRFLRANLSDRLKESAKLNEANVPFLGIDQAKVFEIGTVFMKDHEEIRVAYGQKQRITEMSLDQFCSKGPASFSSGSFEIRHKVDFYLSSAENRVRPDHSENDAGPFSKFQMWSLYPFISRDIAVWVPEGEGPEKLAELLQTNGTKLLVKKPYIFDTFTKDGRISYAFRLVFQSYERTLTDEEVSQIMLKIEEKIKENPAWQIR